MRQHFHAHAGRIARTLYLWRQTPGVKENHLHLEDSGEQPMFYIHRTIWLTGIHHEITLKVVQHIVEYFPRNQYLLLHLNTLPVETPWLKVSDFDAAYLYSNCGNHKPMAGQAYSKNIANTCIPMNGIMPANIWLSVTCGGATPFR